MTTTATDGKMLFNALYQSAVVSGIAAGNLAYQNGDREQPPHPQS